MSAVTDKSNGTMYYVEVGDLNHGKNANCVLIYGDEGSYYLVDTDTGQKYTNTDIPESRISKVYNSNAYRTKADDYNELSDSSNSLTARLNGYGTEDRSDIHDDYMHHTHITQRADLSNLPVDEFFGPSRGIFTSKEDAIKYYTEQGKSDVIQLVDQEIQSGKIKIIDSAVYTTSLTREEAIQLLTSSGQWLRKDAEIYVDSYASANNIFFRPVVKDKYFTGKYVDWYNELKGIDCKALANQVKLDVDNLKIMI